ncbi:hypothetical protein TREMEDRAFT_70985 [Tremella mesenterica DSM 1558]|uniref:uncharacterized protein n=1 Tax=Tremella mesenterica (strain ATCC 24925 / CBS 8224 / DSM 1558 / NBRC 9311 / NRRL Y-6157 / RJB 2259-6 / UBC 559-6) TaxID=578456 RepID=UPI0003F4A09E|nr:uncharacterized protein TREMEDRAFT_70985 [Tremella mesenterica DSM 1558]EIW73515.1 hypothetical protein TREMEDRAFT_70985 [Tremella mesenterica DSM 1558]
MARQKDKQTAGISENVIHRNNHEHLDSEALASTLSIEFPLLDPTLILALLSDRDPSTLSDHLEEIRNQLGILEATLVPDIEEPHVKEEPSDDIGVEIDKLDVNDIELERAGLPDNTSTSTSEVASFPSQASSSTSVADETSFLDDIEHLKSLFPDTSEKDSREALETQPDIAGAIDYLLSIEAIRESEKHGYWLAEESEQHAQSFVPLVPSSSSRSSLASKKSTSHPSTSSGSARQKGKTTITIPIIDTLQRQTPSSSRPSSRAAPPKRRSPSTSTTLHDSPNAWATLASLSNALSDLLPPFPPEHFLSYFHSPHYPSAYSAARASLTAIPADDSGQVDEVSRSVLEDVYGVSLIDDEGSLVIDLRICVQAARGDISTVLDLMNMLADLCEWPCNETDLDRLDKPILHTAKSLSNTIPSSPRSQPSAGAFRRDVIVRPKPQAVKEIKAKVVPGSQSSASAATNPVAMDNFGFAYPSQFVLPRNPESHHPLEWRSQDRRQPRRNTSHPYSAHIPAYARNQLPNDPSDNSLYSLPPSTSSPSMEECLRRASEERKKRTDAIRAAGRHLAGGKAANRIVSGHYALEAREAASRAREWDMRAANTAVIFQLQRGNTIDLHHMTIDEATSAALGAAEEWYAKEKAKNFYGRESVNRKFVPTNELRIVTGVGRHSAGKVGVLGPAVSAALEREGWRVDRGENSRGYLVISGHR